MKCRNCNADVPPQWVHSINTNTCPSCGAGLMLDDELELLSELRESFNQMVITPEGLAGWLLSNYKLTKIGAAEPTQFFVKPEVKPTVAGTHVSPSAAVTEFFKRAGVRPMSPEEAKQKKLTSNNNDVDLDADLSGDDEEDVEASDDFSDSPLTDKVQAAKANFSSGLGAFRRSS